MASHFTWRTIEHYPNGKPLVGGVRLYRVNTKFYKDQLAGILEIHPGDPGCWWYHRGVTQDWARQMTAEGINEKGIWENPAGRANHAWDCSVLLLMAHHMADVATWRRPSQKPAKPKNRPKGPVEKIELW
jgi:phage terminase large subunit GpA-like protein